MITHTMVGDKVKEDHEKRTALTTFKSFVPEAWQLGWCCRPADALLKNGDFGF